MSESKDYYDVANTFSLLLARLQAGDSFDDPVERQRLIEGLLAALNCLQETHEYDFREIGDLLHIAPDAVRQRLGLIPGEEPPQPQ